MRNGEIGRDEVWKSHTRKHSYFLGRPGFRLEGDDFWWLEDFDTKEVDFVGIGEEFWDSSSDDLSVLTSMVRYWEIW